MKRFKKCPLLLCLILFCCPAEGAQPGNSVERLLEGDWTQFQTLDAAREDLNPSAVRTNVLAAAVLHATNQQRQSHGLPALKFHEGAQTAAAMQARIMRDRGSISHENPERPELRTLQDRARAAGLRYRFVAENVATAFALQYESGKAFYSRQENGNTILSYSPGGKPIPRHTYASFAESLVQNWMKSPGHRQNILSQQATHMGASAFPKVNDEAGMTKYYAAQVFFTPIAE